MPDSGYQSTKSWPSVRLGQLDSQANASNQEQNKSPSEASEKGKWLLASSMISALALGVVLWSATIYKIWGGFF